MMGNERAAPAAHVETQAGLAISFEFFPPKTAEAEQSLWRSVQRLAPLGPRFVSVTYGAGGTTRERTHATVTRLRRESPLEPAAHLTCVGAWREEIDAAAAAIELCDGLGRHGVSEFHFYILNRAELTYAICHALGPRPGGAAATAP